MASRERDRVTREWGQAFSRLLPTVFGLRCPNCGEGKLFKSAFALKESCDVCQVRFERDPGAYLISLTLNYFITSIVLIVVALVLVLNYGFFDGLMFLLIGLALVTIFAIYRPVKGLYVWFLWVFGFVHTDPERKSKKVPQA